MSNPIALIKNFLLSETSDSWAMEAKQRIPELLIDHANCELKAASSALSYIYKYPQHEELCQCGHPQKPESLRATAVQKTSTSTASNLKILKTSLCTCQQQHPQ